MTTVLRIYGLSIAKTFVPTPKRPDRLWGGSPPPPRASNSIAAKASFHGSKAAGVVKLTTYAKLVSSLRKSGSSALPPLAFMAGDGSTLLF